MRSKGLELRSGDVLLRMHQRGDAKAWREVRAANHAWLEPWEGTTPDGPHPHRNFGSILRGMQVEVAAGHMYPFAIIYRDRFVGQLTVGNIIRGSLRGAYIGYWIDQQVAGRGIMPTAVALALDFGLGEAGLHRIEISIRPENLASIRVVEKLHVPFEGVRKRYLHIAGAWRDHNIYVVDTENAPAGGFVARWERERAQNIT